MNIQKKNQYYNKCYNSFNFDSIPKKCYQTWEDFNLHPILHQIRKQNQEINPDIEFILFDKKMREEFIASNFPKSVIQAYRRINPLFAVVQADFWRYCVLYINGGIYLDIKSRINQRLFGNIINSKDICLLDIERRNWENFRIDKIVKPSREQWFLVFTKGHPYLKFMINQMVFNINNDHLCVPYNYSSDSSNQTKETIIRLTGPDAFAAAINTCITTIGVLHKEIDIFSTAQCFPYGRPMYNQNNPHYTEFPVNLLFINRYK